MKARFEMPPNSLGAKMHEWFAVCLPLYLTVFQRPPGIGLPDTPVMMHDLNLEEMMVPRYTAPLQPTGKLKVQLQFSENSLNVIIIEVRKNTSFITTISCICLLLIISIKTRCIDLFHVRLLLAKPFKR